jgi:hypothetical protein
VPLDICLVQLIEGLLLLLGGGLPELTGLGEGLLVRETLFLLQTLGSCSVEVDVGSNDSGWLTSLVLGFLFNLG